ncbi:restriction endonuclease subunit S [Acinetobacter indicus]|uniref:Restriction endonuclease subunit S n=1 Tax=Acinetobacter indicus TaxID=756892 RepID=A0A7S6VNG4_9GAMM|nr:MULTISPECIES: restriction endonuclease subunit S [Acinetobacter]QIC77080.1 restriction endonuclease subunit S [Acinetobacter indicus]QOW41964.1 restriction endonuclease subunit S [Acinetobacter indicus]
MAKYQAYAEYKDSGVGFLGEIPEHWIVSKVKYLAPFQVGWTPPTKNDSNFIGDNLWVNISDLKGKVINNTVKQISDKAALEASMDITPKGSLMYSFKLSVGTVSFAGCDMYTNEAIASFLHSAKLPLSYLYYALPKFVIENASTNIYGANILNQELIRNALLVKIPYIEAEKIANFLDHETAKIDHLIEKQKQLIELLKEKRQAVISHAVTKGLDPNVLMKDSGVEWLGEVPEHWNMAPVRRYLVEHRQGYYTTESYVDEGLKLLRITDLRDLGEINICNCPMVNESDTTHLFKLQKGDVVFARTGGAGSFGVITEDYENLIYASYLIRFRFMNKIFEPDYLRFLFQSDSFQLSVKQNIHGGVNQNIHAEDIKNTVICAPSLSEQKEIIEYLENQCLLFENLIYKASYSVKLMQERRTALISSAVTGKIDVRNWQAPTVGAHTELSA